jgi:hypothetical protein
MDGFMELLGWALFYYFIFKIAKIFATAWADRNEEEVGRIKAYLDKIIHRVDVQVVDNVTYWFDQDDHAFLGQGRTVEDLIEVLKQRFPDHVFLLPTEEVVTAKTDWKLVKYEGFHEIKYTIETK